MEPLIPRIESVEVGSKSLAYLIPPGSDFRGDRIRSLREHNGAIPTTPKLHSGTRWFHIIYPLDLH